MHGKLSVRKSASTRLVAVSSSRSANLLQAQEKQVDRRFSAFRQSPQILGAFFWRCSLKSVCRGLEVLAQEWLEGSFASARPAPLVLASSVKRCAPWLCCRLITWCRLILCLRYLFGVRSERPSCRDSRAWFGCSPGKVLRY